MNELIYKNVKLNTDLKSCYVDDKEIRLTKNEYNLLEFLLTNKGKVFNRKEISLILGNQRIALKTVDSVISRLRGKLGNFSKHIITKTGFGYYLL